MNRLVVPISLALVLFLLLLLTATFGTPTHALEDRTVPDQQVALMYSTAITFTPVATAYLPLVIQGGPMSTPTAPDVQVIFIEYDPPGLDSVGEYVDIRNFETGPVTMTDWTLRDEADTVFTFPDFTLVGQTSVRVWVRSGVDDSANLYWGRDSATWNNDGDTAILRNQNGDQVDTCTYSGGGQGTTC